MPRFDLDIPHSLSLPELRTRLERATDKLENQYGAKCTWDGPERLLVVRKGLNAAVNLEAARLRIELELALLLTPLAGSIRNGITRHLTELLAS